MEFEIYEHEESTVTREGEVFLKVSRKQGWRLTTEIYKGDTLIVKAKASNIFPFGVSIKYHALPDQIELRRNHFTVSLYAGDNEFRMQMRFLKRPDFLFYLNDWSVGYAQSANLIMLGHTSYTMKLEVTDEQLNLYFLILFLLSVEPV